LQVALSDCCSFVMVRWFGARCGSGPPTSTQTSTAPPTTNALPFQDEISK
jgi:hypothetical protein